MKMFNIISGWKPLHTGTNGKITYGILVDNVERVAPGYQQQFHINDFSFLTKANDVKLKCGLTDEQYNTLKQSLEKLNESTALGL